MSGHAGYAASGEDIICAAVTALSGTLVKSIENLTDDKIEYDVQPGWVDIKYRDLSEKAKALVDSFFIGICWLPMNSRDISGYCKRQVQARKTLKAVEESGVAT